MSLNRQQGWALIVVLVLVIGLGVLGLARQQPAHDPLDSLEGLAAEAEEELPEADVDLTPVVVHVAGAVREPGVFTLDAGSRVHHAVDAAGGGEEGAALEALNLAAELVDGQKVYVPRAGEEEEVPGFPAQPNEQDGVVNLNTAGSEELQKLPGIGPALSQRIIDYREAHGAFKSPEELQEVSGIGEKRYADLEGLIRAP